MNVGDLVFAPITRSRPHDLMLARITGFQRSLGTVSFEFMRENLEDSSDIPQRVFRAPNVDPATNMPTQATYAALDKMRSLLAKELLPASAADTGGGDDSNLAGDNNSNNHNNNNNNNSAALMRQLQIIFPLAVVADAWSLVLREMGASMQNQARRATRDLDPSTATSTTTTASSTTRIFLMDNWSSAFLLYTPCLLSMLMLVDSRLAKSSNNAALYKNNGQTADDARDGEQDEDEDEESRTESAVANLDRGALLTELKQRRSLMHEALLSRSNGAKLFDTACNFVSILFKQQRQKKVSQDSSRSGNCCFSFVVLFSDSEAASLWAEFLQAVFGPLLASSGVAQIVALGDVERIDDLTARNFMPSEEEVAAERGEGDRGVFNRSLFVGSAEDFTTLCTRDLVDHVDCGSGGTRQQRNTNQKNGVRSNEGNILVLLGDDSLDVAHALAELEMLMFEFYQQQQQQAQCASFSSDTAAATISAPPSIVFEHIDASVHLSALKGHGGTTANSSVDAAPSASASASAATATGSINNSNGGSVVTVRSQHLRKKRQQQEQQERDDLASEQQQQKQPPSKREDEEIGVAAGFVFDGGEAGVTLSKQSSLSRCRWGCCATSCCPFLPCFPVRTSAVMPLHSFSSIGSDTTVFDPLFISSVAADMFVAPAQSSSSSSSPKLRLILLTLSSDMAASEQLAAAEPQLSTLRVEWCRVTVDTAVDLCSGICRQLLSHWLSEQIDGVVVATSSLLPFDSAASSVAPTSSSTAMRNVASFTQTFLLALNACAAYGASAVNRMSSGVEEEEEEDNAEHGDHDDLHGARKASPRLNQHLTVASPSFFARHSSARRRHEEHQSGQGAPPFFSAGRKRNTHDDDAFSLRRRKLQPVGFVRLLPADKAAGARLPLSAFTAVERLVHQKHDAASIFTAMGRRAVPLPFDTTNNNSNNTPSALRWFSSVVL